MVPHPGLGLLLPKSCFFDGKNNPWRGGRNRSKRACLQKSRYFDEQKKTLDGAAETVAKGPVYQKVAFLTENKNPGGVTRNRKG